MIKRMSDFIEDPLLNELRERLNDHADSFKFGWGQIWNKEKYNLLDLPVGGHTSYNVVKGRYVGAKSIRLLLEYFEIPYTYTRGCMGKAMEGENE